MRNLHLILLQEYGIEAWGLFREWERLQLRASDYKNHRIFSLRCFHKDLVPVSIKLKSTLKTVKARQIIRKAEKDLLQARVKAINNILDNVTKQTEECRTQLASIISAERLRECQGFIDKVSEMRFTKVRQRQLNKFNILINKKEGNITRANAINLTCSKNLGSQAVRQASASPLGEGNNPPQTSRLLLTFLPRKEVTQPQQTVSQAFSLILLWQLLTFLLGKEAIPPWQLLTFPWVKEAVSPLTLLWQLLTFLPVKEAILPRQLLTFPQVKEAVLSRQLLTFPLVKEAIPPRPLLTFPWGRNQHSPGHCSPFPWGR